MGKCIAIASGKGGVGKTIATANIGVGLALENKKVCLIDSNHGNRDLECVMGLEHKVIFDLLDIFQGKPIEKALIEHNLYPGLFFIPASARWSSSDADMSKMKEVCSQLCSMFDYVLVDCPTGFEKRFELAITGAEYGIVMVTPELSAIKTADIAIGLLEKYNVRNPKIIINKTNLNLVKQGLYMNIDDIQDILGVDILGTVNDEINLIRPVESGTPIVVSSTKSIAGQDYRNICKRILGVKVPITYIELESKYLNRKNKIEKAKFSKLLVR